MKTNGFPWKWFVARCGTGRYRHRCRIILRCADGLTNKAIAAELDMTPSALRANGASAFSNSRIEGLFGLGLDGPGRSL